VDVFRKARQRTFAFMVFNYPRIVQETNAPVEETRVVYNGKNPQGPFCGIRGGHQGAAELASDAPGEYNEEAAGKG
jgi:hypothetical protein